MTISIRDADQVFRPPEKRQPYIRHDRANDFTLDPGHLWVHDGRIKAFEPNADASISIDASGCAVIPGLVDCHTHLPFMGWRADEYELKVTGVPYEKIALVGGGIAASSRALNEAPDEDVLRQARDLAGEMLRHGTTTFECKSGYGLSVPAELRALDLADRLDAMVEQRTCSTALLAHAVPEDSNADEWMREVAGMLPDVVKSSRAQALDIYVESVAFSNAHLEQMGALAADHGLHLRAHVEQFACHRSVPVALEGGARSVDHLAQLHALDVRPLAKAECAAVLLPGAEFLGAEEVAPGRRLVDEGAICVLATDCNPGTSPITSLPLVAGLAVRRYGWTVREALLAMTLNAAWVLALSEDTGSLEIGKRADVVLLDGPAEHVPYRLGHDPVAVVIVGGRLAWVRPDHAWRVTGA